MKERVRCKNAIRMLGGMFGRVVKDKRVKTTTKIMVGT